MKLDKTHEQVKDDWDKFEQFLIKTRYSIRDKKGNPTEVTYEDVVARVAKWVRSKAVVEKVHPAIRDFYSSEMASIVKGLKNKVIVPATPIHMNASSPTKHLGYFSCYPLGYIEDSMDALDDAGNRMTKIYQSGGGCGINLSKIRAKGELVDNGQGYASGPVSFMQNYDAKAGSVSQGGKRRGALMTNLSENHPDWKEFVESKGSGKYSFINMNISLDIEGELREELLDDIAKNIHTCGDPGLIFIKNAYENTPIPIELEPRHVNPCAEYMSVANTSCNLISINVTGIAKEHSIDAFFNEVFTASYQAGLFGNILIWQSEGYPDETIRKKTQELRPIGIGMLGLHGAMIRYGIKYESDEARAFAKKIQAALALGSMHASAQLRLQAGNMNKDTTAKDYDFPYKHSVPCRTDWMKAHVEKALVIYTPEDENVAKNLFDCLERHTSFYNIVTTVQAPTGSISQLVQSASNGIEPLFAVSTNRKVVDSINGDTFVDLVPHEIFGEDGRITVNLKELHKQVSHNISAKFQIDIMSDIQSLCHTAISKTINVPETFTTDEVKETIRYAFDKKLKAITIYRDSSKSEQILNASGKKKGKVQEDFPVTRDGVTHTFKGPKKVHVTLNSFNDAIREVFIMTGKGGTNDNAWAEALGRVLSKMLVTHPEMKDEIADALSGIDAGDSYSMPGKRFRSIPDAISHLLLSSRSTDHVDNEDVVEETDNKHLKECLKCGKVAVRRTGSCSTCLKCGDSSC